MLHLEVGSKVLAVKFGVLRENPRRVILYRQPPTQGRPGKPSAGSKLVNPLGPFGLGILVQFPDQSVHRSLISHPNLRQAPGHHDGFQALGTHHRAHAVMSHHMAPIPRDHGKADQIFSGWANTLNASSKTQVQLFPQNFLGLKSPFAL